MTEELKNKEIEQLKNELNNLKLKFEKFILHTHNRFDSSLIKISDLDTVLYKQATIDPGSLVDGAGETVQVTGVVGANLGDFVLVSAPYDLQDITVTGYVQANDIIEIRIQNESGNTIDLASGTWRVLVIKKII